MPTATADDGTTPAGPEGAPAASPGAWRRLPTVVTVYGVVLTASLVDRWLLGDGLGAPAGGTVAAVTTVAIALPFTLGFVYGGVRLARGTLPAARFPRIARWWLGASGAFLVINLLMMTVWGTSTVAVAIGWLRFSLVFGGAGGLLVGIVEAGSIERARAAERARVRAERVADTREWLRYLNDILRHEVLNASNVAAGNASLLLDDDSLDEATRDRLAVIERACEDLDDVIREVRLLVASDHGDLDPRRVDLRPVLDTETDAVAEAYDGATVETDLPESLPVLADESVGRVFSNLVANAVEHNDGPDATVRVSGEMDADEAVVRVSDDGPGVPPDERETLFEPANDSTSDHGLGLHIVRTLVDRYGGAVELSDTGPDGSTFTVRLPRATDARDVFDANRETAAAGT
ncbi:sensor histidine kinase [Halobaculum litoreum]|uniref:sensor histidine kinase n=1 Tax=Halobaculum litoreum TaxID=3031998 RepID=UPI0024C454AA|nr:HAMP domain-containing sensor histidine kinase [Halobaculum sp. DT92]